MRPLYWIHSIVSTNTMFSFDCAWHITRQADGQTVMVTCGWHAVCLVPSVVKQRLSQSKFLSVPVLTTITKRLLETPVQICSKLHIRSVIVVRLALLWPRVQWLIPSSHGPNRKGVILLSMSRHVNNKFMHPGPRAPFNQVTSNFVPLMERVNPHKQ